MKKIFRALAVTTVMLGMSTGVATAATSATCSGSISNTGPGSTNVITCDTNNKTTVSCDNDVVVDNSNSQAANSGKAFTTGNTSGGSATSGGASNSNSVDVTLGVGCELVAATTPPPTTPTTPPATTPSTPQVLSESTEAAQVAVVPVGGAGAGQGAGVNSDKTAATFGVLGSASLIGLGFALRKRAFGQN
jgi:hypothetical protein